MVCDTCGHDRSDHGQYGWQCFAELMDRRGAYMCECDSFEEALE